MNKRLELNFWPILHVRKYRLLMFTNTGTGSVYPLCHRKCTNFEAV